MFFGAVSSEQAGENADAKASANVKNLQLLMPIDIRQPAAMPPAIRNPVAGDKADGPPTARAANPARKWFAPMPALREREG